MEATVCDTLNLQYRIRIGDRRCPGGVVDILEACGAFDPGSSPGRGVSFSRPNIQHHLTKMQSPVVTLIV